MRVWLALAFLSACGSSAVLQAVDRGDLVALRTELAAREKQGSLSNSEAAKAALGIARRELADAKGPAASLRVRELRACARELDGPLSDRMKTHDDAGAAAALARLDAGNLGEGAARDFVDDPDPLWRAVGARGLVRTKDGTKRRALFVDPSPDVRRQAVRAARVAADDDDTTALLEVARLDPESTVRVEAIEAIAVLAPLSTTVTQERDLWLKADGPAREAIASTWAGSKLYEVGGHDALAVLVATSHGPGPLEGASALLRARRKDDAELVSSALANVLRALAAGASVDRLHALAVIPLDAPGALDAVKKASTESDPEVKISALSRLLEVGQERDATLRALEGIASPRARFALASVGHLRVQAWLEKDLEASESSQRIAAVWALAALGRSARGAILLADAEPSIRTQAACALLVASRAGK